MGIRRKLAKLKPKDKINKSSHSMNIDRDSSECKSGFRSKTTIKRLQMYRNSKPKRNSNGEIIRPAPFQSSVSSGTMARIEPNRRWFGNTRVITQDSLQKFKEAVAVSDPFRVILRRSLLPVTLLNEKFNKSKIELKSINGKRKPNCGFEKLEEYVNSTNTKINTYQPESDLRLQSVSNPNEEKMISAPVHFNAGHNRRLWSELYKVVDSSDVILYLLDARDPLGTRSEHFENGLKKQRPCCHLIYILNKCDLVPKWVVKKWKTYLCKSYPCVAFRSSITNCFGKKDLISILQQFANIHKDKQQISVGVIGYPNVGKSSLINSLKGKLVCKVAPIPGETKIWQYITLFKRIYLIDCPGVVPPDDRDETSAVIKGVVRVERLANPEMFIDAVLDRVNADYIASFYKIQNTWTDSLNFLELLAVRNGKLLKKGEPDIMCCAKMVLSDFQRGRLPFFSLPPSEPAESEPT